MLDCRTLPIVQEIVGDLSVELKTDTHFDEEICAIKVANACREIIIKRNYSVTSMSEQEIADDLYNYYSNILNLARYDYNKLGAEGEVQHTESSVNRSWVNREQMFYGVHPFVKVL